MLINAANGRHDYQTNTGRVSQQEAVLIIGASLTPSHPARSAKAPTTRTGRGSFVIGQGALIRRRWDDSYVLYNARDTPISWVAHPQWKPAAGYFTQEVTRAHTWPSDISYPDVYLKDGTAYVATN